MRAAAGLSAFRSAFRPSWGSGKTAAHLCDTQRVGKPNGGSPLTSAQQPEDVTVEEDFKHSVLLKNGCSTINELLHEDRWFLVMTLAVNVLEGRV